MKSDRWGYLPRMVDHSSAGNGNSDTENDILLQLLRRLSLEADFEAETLHQLCIDLRDAAEQRGDEKSKISARLAGKIADLIKKHFMTEGNGARPHRNGGSKNKRSGC